MVPICSCLLDKSESSTKSMKQFTSFDFTLVQDKVKQTLTVFEFAQDQHLYVTVTWVKSTS